MGLFDFLEGSQNQQTYDQVVNTPNHESSFGHEAIAGAASFAALRAYEKHVAANGKPQNHALALEVLAGFAGAEVDKLIETKGLNEVDALKAKRQAKAKAAAALQQSGQYEGNLDDHNGSEFGEEERRHYREQESSGGFGW